MNRPDALAWRCRHRVLRLDGRALVMGVLNVTPDSFSDGGCHAGPEEAVAHGLALAREGADLIDVGGESTRPGAAAVAPDEELRRVVPVVAALRRALGDGPEAPVLSVDTRKAAVAARALEAGAAIVNDVSALTDDPDMPAVVRRARAGVILMHMRGTPETMQADPRYDDVVRDVAAYLRERLDALRAAGLDPETLAVDPGIGFGKTVAHNLRLLARLEALQPLGRPIVVGVSRKRFLGTLTGRDVGERLPASVAALACAALHGAHVVRVHDVRASADAVRVVAAVRAEEAACPG
jgi:dihydropteroate synthase